MQLGKWLKDQFSPMVNLFLMVSCKPSGIPSFMEYPPPIIKHVLVIILSYMFIILYIQKVVIDQVSISDIERFLPLNSKVPKFL